MEDCELGALLATLRAAAARCEPERYQWLTHVASQSATVHGANDWRTAASQSAAARGTGTHSADSSADS